MRKKKSVFRGCSSFSLLVSAVMLLTLLFSSGCAMSASVEVTPSPSPAVTPARFDILAEKIPLLVNKTYPMEKDCEPADLVRVKDVLGDVITYADENDMGVRKAVEALAEMICAAQAEGITPWKLGTAYRSYADQQAVFDKQVEKYINDCDMSRSKAISVTKLGVADPGCSEHHTGLAFDLNVPGKTFIETEQCDWLQKHCWEYGFIIRYTDEKQEITGFRGEKWHVRYVGREHAARITELDIPLETYVAQLREAQFAKALEME